MLRLTKAPIAACMLLIGSVVTAQTPPAEHVMKAAPTSARNEATIQGRVLDRNAHPYPNAIVRLRNLLTHQLEDTSTSGETGEFMFLVKPGIPYVVEVGDELGRVLAVSNAITPLGGEAVAATVSTTLTSQVASVAGLFRESAGLVLSAASSAGVTALSAWELPPPASPEK
jgi:hypothetical protein